MAGAAAALRSAAVLDRCVLREDGAPLAGAHLDNGNPEILLNSISHYYRFLPGEQQRVFLENLREQAA